MGAGEIIGSIFLVLFLIILPLGLFVYTAIEPQIGLRYPYEITAGDGEELPEHGAYCTVDWGKKLGLPRDDVGFIYIFFGQAPDPYENWEYGKNDALCGCRTKAIEKTIRRFYYHYRRDIYVVLKSRSGCFRKQIRKVIDITVEKETENTPFKVLDLTCNDGLTYRIKDIESVITNKIIFKSGHFEDLSYYPHGDSNLTI